jgi:hypothetical protein
MVQYIKLNYGEWKDMLFHLLLNSGIKKKKAKAMSLEYEEEFTIGMTPEEVYRIIINGTDRNKQ